MNPKKELLWGLWVRVGRTWRFMGSYKWGYKSPNMGYNYSYPTYNPSYDSK